MRINYFNRIILLLLLLPPTWTSAQYANLPAGVDAETGFRLERYRAPVPDFLPDGTVLDSNEVLAAHQAGKMLFIDVYPPKGLGPDPLDGSWLTNEQHHTIPQSIWLPEVGRGHLEQDAADYFRRNLDRLTSENQSHPLLFFCTADCWQSWNAARRAILWGFSNVYWFPEGTDGWLDLGLSLVAATPVNFLEKYK